MFRSRRLLPCVTRNPEGCQKLAGGGASAIPPGSAKLILHPGGVVELAIFCHPFRVHRFAIFPGVSLTLNPRLISVRPPACYPKDIFMSATDSLRRGELRGSGGDLTP